MGIQIRWYDDNNVSIINDQNASVLIVGYQDLPELYVKIENFLVKNQSTIINQEQNNDHASSRPLFDYD